MKLGIQNIFQSIWLTIAFVIVGGVMVYGQKSVHPRIYVTDQNKAVFLQTIENVPWKKELVTRKKERLQKYIALWKNDKEWLVSRLQMNWKTKHDKVYLEGGDFSHSEGKAPVPTVRFSGSKRLGNRI